MDGIQQGSTVFRSNSTLLDPLVVTFTPTGYYEIRATASAVTYSDDIESWYVTVGDGSLPTFTKTWPGVSNSTCDSHAMQANFIVKIGDMQYLDKVQWWHNGALLDQDLSPNEDSIWQLVELIPGSNIVECRMSNSLSQSTQKIWSITKGGLSGEAGAMYVQDLKENIGNTQWESEVIGFALNNNITEVALYDVNYCLDNKMSDFNSFFDRLKDANLQIGLVVSNPTRPAKFMNSLATTRRSQVDFMIPEIEWWSNGYLSGTKWNDTTLTYVRAFEMLKETLDAMNVVGVSYPNCKRYGYIGFLHNPTGGSDINYAYQIELICDLVSKVWLTAYVDDPIQGWSYIGSADGGNYNRIQLLDDYNDNNTDVDIVILMSAEDPLSDGGGNFSGDWLYDNAFQVEQAYNRYEEGNPTITTQGFAWFSNDDLFTFLPHLKVPHNWIPPSGPGGGIGSEIANLESTQIIQNNDSKVNIDNLNDSAISDVNNGTQKLKVSQITTKQIKWELTNQSGGLVQLYLFDISGRKVKLFDRYTNDNLIVDYHTILGHKNSIYVLVYLKDGEIVESKKFVIID